MNRRKFLSSTFQATISLSISASLAGLDKLKQPIKIGIITDLHHDIMHDGKWRLTTFLESMKVEKVNALLQMGDFAYPGDKNGEVINLFNNAHSNRMHVIGNHDTDGGFKKEQCVSYWGMPAAYYAKQVDGIWFVVLNGNEKGSPIYKSGYPSYIGETQSAWLEQQLRTLEGPIVIVSHQPLAGAMAVDNAADIQTILSKSANKILLAINGHTHVDSLLNINGVQYLHINSASYFWVGGNYKHEMFEPEIHKSNPYISSTCPYKEPLFTMMTIDPSKKTINIMAKKSEWVGKSPAELAYKDTASLAIGKEIVPFIRPRKIKSKV